MYKLVFFYFNMNILNFLKNIVLVYSYHTPCYKNLWSQLCLTFWHVKQFSQLLFFSNTLRAWIFWVNVFFKVKFYLKEHASRLGICFKNTEMFSTLITFMILMKMKIRSSMFKNQSIFIIENINIKRTFRSPSSDHCQLTVLWKNCKIYTN